MGKQWRFSRFQKFLFKNADEFPIVIIILKVDNFTITNFFFLNIQGMKRFHQSNTVSGNGDIVVFALGILFQSGKDALSNLFFAFAVFKVDVFVLRVGAAPFAIKFSEFFYCLSVMHSFGDTDINFGKTFIILERGFNNFGNNAAGLFGAAERAGDNDINVFIFEAVGSIISLINSAVG